MAIAAKFLSNAFSLISDLRPVQVFKDAALIHLINNLMNPAATRRVPGAGSEKQERKERKYCTCVSVHLVFTSRTGVPKLSTVADRFTSAGSLILAQIAGNILFSSDTAILAII